MLAKTDENFKSAGFDRLSVDMIKEGLDTLIVQMLNLFNLCWQS